jgi:hypothetical protein
MVSIIKSYPKVAREHGIGSVKVAGSSVIGSVQDAQESLEGGQEKAEGEMKDWYHNKFYSKPFSEMKTIEMVEMVEMVEMKNKFFL